MNIIGQNGNEGEHYDEEPYPVKILQKGPSIHRVLYSDGTEKKMSKDDNIIRYM